MTPLGATLTVIIALTVLLAPRRWAALGVVAAVCYITQGQQIPIAGFHFTAIRIVLLAGMIRIVARQELKNTQLNKIDWAVIIYTGFLTLMPCLRVGTSEEFVYRLGCAYDILMSYFVFRGLLTDLGELQQFLVGLTILILPMALFMVIELLTHRSLFAAFGGIGDLYLRDERPRCQGAFRHGITAGVFGATLIPMFVGLYRAGIQRRLAMIGLLAAATITYTSNSSGPLMAFVSGVVALLFWRWREKMKIVRWGIILLLICLHLSMKVPVWFIFSKLGDLTGGDGWYRSYLIDQFIRHVFDWWVAGITETGDWMPTQMPNGQADLTNQYVSAGVGGGIMALIFFVLILVRCFRSLGAAMQQVREQSPEVEKLLWGIGAALFAHVVTLFSVTYFDQMYVAWWALPAIIAGVTASIIKSADVPVAAEEMPEPSLVGTLASRSAKEPA